MPVGSSFCCWRDANGLRRFERHRSVPRHASWECHTPSAIHMFSTLPPVVWQASIVPEDGVDNMKLPWNPSVLGSSCCWCKSCGYCFFNETACGCADLVIISDLPMISLNHIKSYYFKLSFTFDHSDLLFQWIRWFPKTHPNTSDAVAPLRLFASLRCCGHSQRASAWWSDHWGNACIASWDAAFNKLCLPPKVWETKTHTLPSSTLQVEPVTLRSVDCNHSNDEQYSFHSSPPKSCATNGAKYRSWKWSLLSTMK